MMHHEMQEEDDYKEQHVEAKGGPIKSHLKEQKGMGHQGNFK